MDRKEKETSDISDIIDIVYSKKVQNLKFPLVNQNDEANKDDIKYIEDESFYFNLYNVIQNLSIYL